MLDVLKRFRTAVILVIYLLIGFALLLTERGTNEDGDFGTLGAIFAQGVAGTQDLTHYGVGGVGDLWDRYIDLVAVNEENARMRAELDRLREEHTRLLGVMQENARLRAMVGFQDAHPTLTLVPARVIAKDVSPHFRVLSVRLDVSDSRVEVGMPVVSSAGIVGHIDEIAGRYAEVMLAVDPRSSVDVLVQRNRARGVLQGLGHDNDYASRIAYLLRRDGAQAGDIVVTSGMGGRFPPDLMVGRISEVEEQNFGLYQEVVVEPSTDFSRLEEVFIIVGQER